VFAAGAGRVALAENRISTGWSVVIEHLPGLYSLYYHMDSLAVKAGQMVKQGEEIGKSGATGLATGPHLHWEMRLNGSPVNPDMFLGDFSFFDEKH
jgi:murein DD-endopeptidase MepM/ murein hydrolase activator NlpD